MLSKIFGYRRSNFDTYMANLVRKGIHGGPTADEARKDYNARVAASVFPRF